MNNNSGGGSRGGGGGWGGSMDMNNGPQQQPRGGDRDRGEPGNGMWNSAPSKFKNKIYKTLVEIQAKMYNVIFNNVELFELLTLSKYKISLFLQ